MHSSGFFQGTQLLHFSHSKLITFPKSYYLHLPNASTLPSLPFYLQSNPPSFRHITFEYGASRAFGPRAFAPLGPSNISAQAFSRASAPLRPSGPGLFRTFELLGLSSISFWAFSLGDLFFVQHDPLQESPTGSQAGLAARVQILERFC